MKPFLLLLLDVIALLLLTNPLPAARHADARRKGPSCGRNFVVNYRKDKKARRVARKLAACPVVGGTVTISGAKRQSQLDFPALTTAAGLFIRANPSLKSLAGLDGVRTVEGGEVAVWGNPALTSLAGLESLVSTSDKRVGHLRIFRNANLAQLAEFRSVQDLGVLTVVANPRLASLTGLEHVSSMEKLYVWKNTVLASLAGLGAPSSPAEEKTMVEVSIRHNPALTSLGDAFQRVRELPHLDVVENDALASLNGLESLTTTSTFLYIRDNAGLTSLAGLDNLRNAHDMYIWNNTALTSLAGLGGLQSAESVRIYENSRLVSLAGLDQVADVEVVEIEGNGALTSLEGLGIRSVNRLTVKRNARLTSLDGLTGETWVAGALGIFGNPNLEQLTEQDGEDLLKWGKPGRLPNGVADSIFVFNNTALRTLDGIGAIRKITKSLVVALNPSLSSLHGLHRLESVGLGLSIYGNSGLNSLAGMDTLQSVGRLTVSLGGAGGRDSFAGFPQLAQVGSWLSIRDLQAHQIPSLAADFLPAVPENSVPDVYLTYDTGSPPEDEGLREQVLSFLRRVCRKESRIGLTGCA